MLSVTLPMLQVRSSLTAGQIVTDCLSDPYQLLVKSFLTDCLTRIMQSKQKSHTRALLSKEDFFAAHRVGKGQATRRKKDKDEGR